MGGEKGLFLSDKEGEHLLYGRELRDLRKEEGR